MSNYHPATYILIDGLKEIGTPEALRVLYDWDQTRHDLDELNKPAELSGKENHAAVKIGRLQKRIERLTKQRDFYKERYEHYAKVIELQPYIGKRYEDYQTRVQKEEINKRNAKAVKEQEKLIELLLKENAELRSKT